MSQTEYGAKVTAIIDATTGGFEYPDNFESDVAACFLNRMSPEQAAEKLLAEYAIEMNAELHTMIQYQGGCIEVVESLEQSTNVTDFEVIESNCKGWGESNAVVKLDGIYYLATVSSN